MTDELPPIDQAWIRLMDLAATDIIVSIEAMAEVIKRHGLKPDAAGFFRMTEAMGREAEAIDVANGTALSPEDRRQMIAALDKAEAGDDPASTH
jgi:hypothetical protein